MAKLWLSDAKKLLDFVHDEDIFQIASTVCNDRLKFSCKNEAIEAILAACESPTDLLKRKKMKRDYLLGYIWKYGRSGSSTSLPMKADKRQLIREILTLWSYEVGRDDSPIPMDEDSGDEDSRNETQPNLPRNLSSEFLVEFASRFLDWFYNLLNNCYRDDGFGPNHFYGNCLLRLRCGTTNENSVSIEVEGGMNVSEQLKDFVVRERLAFQPNLRSPFGFQTIQESHGAVMVKSNGILHRRSLDDHSQLFTLGPYEQTFLLIEDPQAKSWKIQQTALNVKAEITVTNAIDFR